MVWKQLLFLSFPRFPGHKVRAIELHAWSILRILWNSGEYSFKLDHRVM